MEIALHTHFFLLHLFLQLKIVHGWERPMFELIFFVCFAVFFFMFTV